MNIKSFNEWLYHTSEVLLLDIRLVALHFVENCYDWRIRRLEKLLHMRKAHRTKSE